MAIEIVYFPLKMVIFHSKLLVYQRYGKDIHVASRTVANHCPIHLPQRVTSREDEKSHRTSQISGPKNETSSTISP